MNNTCDQSNFVVGLPAYTSATFTGLKLKHPLRYHVQPTVFGELTSFSVEAISSGAALFTTKTHPKTHPHTTPAFAKNQGTTGRGI